MKEELLQYAWQNKLFSRIPEETTAGEKIEIIDYGKKNENAGPDFFNAKIRIGKTLWAGNVEIHCASSDWVRHKHHKDDRYDSVILHVVEKADCPVYRKNGEEIPQVEIRINKKLEEGHRAIFTSDKWIRCEDLWYTIPDNFLSFLLSKLLNERYIRKTCHLLEHLRLNNNNWEEVFYIQLARSFGMNVNALPFEMLAKSVPLFCIHKHRNNLLQIEALFLGQAGLLSLDHKEMEKDIYYEKLRKEYVFLSGKFSLKPLDISLWKFSKMRPGNFPQVRIAQFAKMIFQSPKLFSSIINTEDITHLRDLFQCEASVYWNTHYTFGGISADKKKRIGERTIDLLLINTVIPFLFAYSLKKDLPDLQERAYLLLEKIPPERNSIIADWERIGVRIKSAYETQALLELKKQYCENKRCLQCTVGCRLLSSV
jgi:hypothetical protein